MKTKWWSCVLGLLCMSAEVILNPMTAASQSPLSISVVGINSSLETRCNTSLQTPTGLSLRRRFLGNQEIMYLHLHNGVPTKNTTADKFRNRISVIQEEPNRGVRYQFKLKLLQLGLDDTDLYYCSWSYTDDKYTVLSLESNGTIVIVKENVPKDPCSSRTMDFTFICLGAVAFTTILLMFVWVMIVRCRRFKRRFTPGRPYAPPLPPRPPRPDRHGPIYLQQQTNHHCPYMMTSTNNYGIVGYG